MLRIDVETMVTFQECGDDGHPSAKVDKQIIRIRETPCQINAVAQALGSHA
jgi:putative IMPACT (imprinted ancient) family translation regulator